MARGRGFPSSLRQVWLRESFFQSSQQRLPRSPLRGEETAASAPVSPPPAQGSELACWEQPGFPAGKPSSPGRKPQLTQAAPKAEAARPDCAGRTAAPTPGACTGAQAFLAPRGRSRGGALRLSGPRAPPRSLQVLFSWPGLPGGSGLRVGGPWAAMPPGPSRNFQPLLNSSPPRQPGGKGRVQCTTRPL